MDDIEDLINSVPEIESPSCVEVKVLRQVNEEESKQELVNPKASVIPGVQSVWLHTFGCAHNVSDGEYMKGELVEYGYILTCEKDNADVWVINSCTVKDPSQASFLSLVQSGLKLGKHIVVTGCVPQADRKIKLLEGVSMLGVKQFDKIVYAVEETIKGNTVRLLGKNKALPRLDLPKVRKNRLVEILPLSTGCLGSCTYCKTKHARGKLGSYDPDVLIERVERVLGDGEVREIWLASEDTGAYGRDINTNIAELLNKLKATMDNKGNPSTMLRLGMTNPPFIMDHLDQIAETLRHPNVFNFIHLPVQSGSNSVLERMRREYTIEEFKRICNYLIKYSPGVTIATDVICGFPGETDEEFEETINLIEEYKFPILNISKFYARPGTPAAKMKRVDTSTIKQRSRRVSTLFESYGCYDRFVGRQLDVWVTTEIGHSPEGEEQSVGHTKEYVKCLLPRNDELIGKKVSVRIVAAEKFHIIGYIQSN